ncbi:MAG: DUF4270 family protein [Lewinellaceae bacterium]|nr:DUF4270 family protein [Phaeodactylibacter sp.]MCB0614096.1 DUF4270 family protein [Phaeodactylibacter sp.]MCB9347370.1 DUF4270 family protein [Lewinellaceae bacterium]
MRLTSFVCAVALIGSVVSCSDPTLVGGSLLEDDKANVGFSDTLSITATSITNDSIRTYTPFNSSQLATYLLGNLNDPLFGRSSSTIYAQVYPENNNPRFRDSTRIDSIVLVLPYDIDNFYAKAAGETFDIEVFQLAEALVEDNEYYSNQAAAVDPMRIGNAQAMVRTDSIEFIDYEGTDTALVKFPHYRIPLDGAVADLLVGLDSAIYASDSLFLDAFKGIQLKSANEDEGMLSFDLLSPDAGIYLYYRDSTGGKPKRFLYDFDIQPTVRFTNYQNSYDGAPVAQFLNKPALGDSLIFVQGMSGLEAKLEIPNVTSLQGLIVNKAELEVYVANIEGDESDFSPISQLILTAPNSEGTLVAIEDIEIILSQRRSLEDLFGGTPLLDSNGGPTLYKMNLSAHFQEVIDGSRANVLYITPYRKAETASRSILYGAKHPQYGIKLKLAFTKL